jgi:hypothetical protein
VEDEIHPSKAGSYAAACCFYAAIFRNDPSLISYDYTLSPEVAGQIKTAVKRVMYDSLLSWHIGEYDLFSDFSYSQLNGYTFQFTSQSQNENGQVWDFGAVIDTTANPTFTFPGSGTYLVQLTSFNPCDTIASNQEIYVSGIISSFEGIDMPEKSIIYPNPAIDKVYLNLKSTKGISINIYSLSGSRVIAIDDLDSNEIDISPLKIGLYFLEIVKGRETIIRKLIIKK